MQCCVSAVGLQSLVFGLCSLVFGLFKVTMPSRRVLYPLLDEF